MYDTRHMEGGCFASNMSRWCLLVQGPAPFITLLIQFVYISYSSGLQEFSFRVLV
jgi:hypothetical protein